MESSISKIVGVFIALVLMFGYPLYHQALRQDNLSQIVVHSAVTEFVDAARTKGYITPQMYQDLTSKLGATGNQYQIEMEHLHKKYYPIYGDPADPADFKNSFTTFFDGHYTDEITKMMFPDNNRGLDDVSRRYVMVEGDFFTVKVKNINRTMATVLQDFFLNGNTGDNTRVFMSYGGMIINEDY
ncbi:hypothetical protein AWM70_12615 [Paenibacillus yonginensis]|uniref:Uncharacterized protein n=1 Tax=Paenibacillus yonginensis TaxID=1462996 RepID=A0A1B1N1R2_9BACL|nr:hypothetical protein [Paenibacillus yonginensis]ANS75346.1 hypothetical protein AWM70_12615 [Paenibacillus yonginensis]